MWPHGHLGYRGEVHSTSESLYHQIAGVLRAHIEQGVYPAGTFLPSEAEMRCDLGISRMTIRRALAVLREEGLISTKRGSLSVVRSRGTAETLVLQATERLTCRMPSHLEREALALDTGVPLLVVRGADGSSTVYAADTVEVISHRGR